ncbi:hypothetical protein GCM10010339_65730 [Streptomyces alanosinicus]|uniref:Uncharacterized protein n=1 Tax=Streptomyces alanosinicus TaxID=68171 RepID=A0A918YP06_9ACTN|nr:hypothetical protein GCM10010339_65730 [Streptomyces alanosinicus]
MFWKSMRMTVASAREAGVSSRLLSWRRVVVAMGSSSRCVGVAGALVRRPAVLTTLTQNVSGTYMERLTPVAR